MSNLDGARNYFVFAAECFEDLHFQDLVTPFLREFYESKGYKVPTHFVARTTYPNGYGASVIYGTIFSWGTSGYELAVMRVVGDKLVLDQTTYITEREEGVLYCHDELEVTKALEKVKNLPVPRWLPGYLENGLLLIEEGLIDNAEE